MPEPADSERTAPFVLALAGDVMTGRGVDQLLPDPVDPGLHESYVGDARQYLELAEEASGELPERVDPDYIWGELLEAMERVDPDARIVNLETSITRSDQHWIDKSIHYRMSPENALCLQSADLDVCVLANNHVLDWGFAGLEETLETLEAFGIAWAGAGRDLDAATRPAIVEPDSGGRVLVDGLCSEDAGIPWRWAARANRPGVHLIDDYSADVVEEIGERVAAAREPGDLVVASIHWGGNWGYDIPEAHRHFGRMLIDEAGIDLVHGHSSHHVKGLEIHDGHLILYGCGDLLTDYEGIRGHESYRGELSYLYVPHLDPASGRLRQLELIPTRLEQLRLHRANDDEARWLADVLERESRPDDLEIGVLEDATTVVDHPSFAT